MTDYLAVMGEIPAKHTGLLEEQINRAAMLTAAALRPWGMSLPGETGVAAYGKVRRHLCQMVNRALEMYFSAAKRAPAGLAANEIWGEDEDDLFHIIVTGLSEDPALGFTADIVLNVLYAESGQSSL